MTLQSNPELFWLTLTTIMTGLMWFPYIISLIRQKGARAAIMDGQNDVTLTKPWARRAKRAHTNAIENIAIFGFLVIALHLMELGTELTATVSAIYFSVRVIHWLVYTGGLPVVRTVFFFLGFICQMILAATLVGLI